jgi:hypothetical protein
MFHPVNSLVLVIALSTIASAVSAQPAERKALPPEEAVRSAADTEVTVRFRVESAGIARAAMKAGPGRTSPSISLRAKQEQGIALRFSALLMREVPGAFARLGIHEPAKYLKDRTVEVSGKIKKHASTDPDRPNDVSYQIDVTTLENFRVVD